MRKALSLLLALCLSLCLACPMFAEEPPAGVGEGFQKIALGEWMEGALTGEPAFYRFDLPADGFVTVRFRHTPTETDSDEPMWYLHMGFLDYGGEPQAYYMFDEVHEAWEEEHLCPPTGLKSSPQPVVTEWWGAVESYFLEIGGTSSQPYSFCVEFTPADDWETEDNNLGVLMEGANLTPLTLGKTYNAAFSVWEDSDLFKLTLDKPARLRLTMTHEVFTEEETAWHVALVDLEDFKTEEATGSKVVYDYTSFEVNAADEKPVVYETDATLPAGDHYLLVESAVDPETGYPPYRLYYTVKVEAIDDTPPLDNIGQFVDRLYTTCLERKPDEGGFNTWYGVLKDKSWTAERVAWGFVFSKEYTNKHTSNDAYVRMLYRVYMDREADQGGYDTWMKLLNSGEWTREQVMQGFSRSVEFKNICARYGMTPW